MRKFLPIFYILFSLLLLLFPYTANATKIVVDAGHGGSNPGAIGVNGLQEKTVTLDIAVPAQLWDASAINQLYSLGVINWAQTNIRRMKRTQTGVAVITLPSLRASQRLNTIPNTLTQLAK